MRHLRRLDDIVKETVQFIVQSGMTYENLNLTEQGVGELYNVLEVTGLLPQVLKKQGKSDVESERLRNCGNKIFVNKNDIEALQLYTKAICFAHPDGKEIALAYANRSAVTFALQEYAHAISDINCALSIDGYPENLKYKLYERRGKCYLALYQQEKALQDFNQVKSLLHSSALVQDKIDYLNSQMDSLISQCAVQTYSPEAESTVFPSLSHDPSPYIQSASSAVDVLFTVDMGRHIVASTDINPGDVLAIERPFASVLLPSSYDLFCDNCKRRSHSSIPCLSCNEVVFCSESCRQTSWTSYHSLECEILPTLVDIGCDKMGLLAVRVLLLATKCGRDLQKFMVDYLKGSNLDEPPEKLGFVNDGQYLSDNYTSTHHLVTNQEYRSHEDMIRRATIATCLVHVLKESTRFFDATDSVDLVLGESCRKLDPISDLNLNHIAAADLLLRYLMSAPCNAHEIAEMRVWPVEGEQDTESTEIGSAVYPFLSLLNHSCDPNVVRHAYNGDTVVLSAIQFIPKGQQIFDNYGYHHAIHNISIRHSHLKTQYFFTCECTACTNNWPLYHDLPEGPPTFISTGAEKVISDSSENFSRVLLEIKKGRTTAEDFLFLVKYLALLHKTIVRPWKQYNQCQEAIKQCLSLKANHYIHNKPRN